MSGTTFSVAQSFISDVLNIPKYYYNIQEALLVIENKEIQKINSSFCWKTGIITLENVSFFYEDKKIIDSISYTFKPQRRVGIVGFSGSGKSSLIMLLLGIYKPTTGEIYIDEQNIKTINIDAWHEKCSVIFQNNNILDRSIIENITYSDEFALNKEAYEVIMKELALSSINPDVEVKHLSGGEKQRINIGRALYKNSSEIYIFDEPTSNLDAITEDIIMNRINKIPYDKMIIMITHKLSLIQHFDEILVFDKGKIIERGSHNTLLDQDGLYKKLWDLKEVN
jgi:ATP-binding cassette subfamily B protein